MSTKNKSSKICYWICEKSDDTIYVYPEEKDHHIVAEISRQEEKLTRLDQEIFSHECNVDIAMPNNSYIVMDFSFFSSKNCKKKQ